MIIILLNIILVFILKFQKPGTVHNNQKWGDTIWTFVRGMTPLTPFSCSTEENMTADA